MVSSAICEVKKKKKKIGYSDDCISDLPDEILIYILSLLTMKEAARTSILSRRWTSLWTFIPKLEFHSSLWGVKFKNLFESERSRLLKSIKQVLKSHRALTIDKFEICFDVGGDCYKSHLDAWLNFAFKKKVKTLILNLYYFCGWSPIPNYIFTLQFLNNYSLDSLTVLFLHRVDVTGQVIEYFLSNCPFLEQLSLSAAISLVNLKVSGPSLKLKSLIIHFCHRLKYIEVSGLNLASFKYMGPKTNMSFKDVPCLVEVSLGSEHGFSVLNNGFRDVSHLSQLQKFILKCNVQMFNGFPNLAKLKNLKQLKLLLDVSGSDNLLCLMSILKACPLLHLFQLGLICINASAQGELKVRRAKHSHQHLKEFQLAGFIGCKVDVELILCITKNVALLEKIVIDPLSPFAEIGNPISPFAETGNRNYREKEEKEETPAARSRAWQLKTRLPPTVDLVVL